jgi:hypothetical protein
MTVLSLARKGLEASVLRVFAAAGKLSAVSALGIVTASLVVPPVIAFTLFKRRIGKRPPRRRTATVLVLGDIGRSPRMMYHAESLARAGWDTFVVGYGGRSTSCY